eukprot:CAMPEP_0197842016 /NCGR_PEP_ID=MMETSP1437-20131217/46501_1 /TAXON_ID=49252 ORGANISM="Eucampia antarctica, Strain CCMP1452" /NCGR_SAMPLE_ID=MMETSP1437 /ASSEMBLY_ACC=CAM_ASM_001096 /LENGTH=141 /DNA_ID=CAMNT_0043451843 /DNA_START=108 /DNA_END=533 /DNA_ORIENTATION=-
MKSPTYALFVAAIAVSTSEAFNVSSRKAFLSKVATAGAYSAAAVVVIAAPNSASAGDGLVGRVLKKNSAEKKQRKAADVGGEPSSETGRPQPSQGKAGSNEAFRGGKQASDKVEFGTELNKGQTEVADGLMGKLGMPGGSF